MTLVQVFYLLAALTGAASGLFWKKYIYVDLQMTWTNAQAHCRNHFSDLASFENDFDYARMKNDTVQFSSVNSWIGLNKQRGETSYTKWSDGTAFSFKKWKAGEPSDLNNVDCAFTQFNQWIDGPCNTPLKFICYKWEPTIVLVNQMKTWPEAQDYCRTHYIDMISLASNRDVLVVKNQSMSAQTPSIWINLQFLDHSWFWANNDYPGNLQALPPCPNQPFRCGAKTAADVLENRDCEEEMNFICYHY